MQRNTANRSLATKCWTLVISIMLFLTACGGGGSSPSPGYPSTPQATPTKSGYSLLDQHSSAQTRWQHQQLLHLTRGAR
jgi:hypothetical protein